MRTGFGLRFYALPEDTYEVSTASGSQLGTVKKFTKGWTAYAKDGSNIGWFARRAEAGEALFDHRPGSASPQGVVNDLANRYEAAMHRIDELEDQLAAAADVISAREHGEADGNVERSPGGCPNMDDWEWLRPLHRPSGFDPCTGHVWTLWHPHRTDVLSEFRRCVYCGALETQTLSMGVK